MTTPLPSRILVIGYGSESTISSFTTQLKTGGFPFELLDLDAIRPGCCLSFQLSGPTLTLRIDDQIWRLDDFSAFYCRLYFKQTRDPGTDTVFSKLVESLTAWLLCTNKKVVNKPGSGSSNYSKLIHLLDLQSCGFRIPSARIIGDERVAQSALADLSHWISKGCSSYRTRVEPLGLGMYANLDLLAYCPSQFQQKITGANVRVHMVGATAIGLKITTPNLDYRYDTVDNCYEEISVPPEVCQSCQQYCYNEKLLFAGFDFIIDQEGDWYVLEANPMPGFEFYDRKIAYKIATTLANFLSQPAPLVPLSLPIDGPFIGKGRRKKFF